MVDTCKLDAVFTRVNTCCLNLPAGSSGDSEPPQKQVDVLLTMPREAMALALALAHSIIHCRMTQARMLATRAEIYQTCCIF
jgi:hypothetical protein